MLPGAVAGPSLAGGQWGAPPPMQTCTGGPPTIGRCCCWCGCCDCGFTIAYRGRDPPAPPLEKPPPACNGAKRRGTKLPRINGPCGCGGGPGTTTGSPLRPKTPPPDPPVTAPPPDTTTIGCCCCCCCPTVAALTFDSSSAAECANDDGFTCRGCWGCGRTWCATGAVDGGGCWLCSGKIVPASVPDAAATMAVI